MSLDLIDDPQAKSFHMLNRSMCVPEFNSNYNNFRTGFGNLIHWLVLSPCTPRTPLISEFLTNTEAMRSSRDFLTTLIVEEFQRCILRYFAYLWIHADLMISQILSEPKKKLKHIVIAATREQRLERVTKTLKVARVFNTLVLKKIPSLGRIIFQFLWHINSQL
ncbi:Zeta_toxin domain-containing protein [Raphanus sativus]|nr:Zeta_toxin domain-containing protein [Raphanus sativus]KAJ4865911.1 Zeta_toxin domain-containing protein [Raphanus sativus]KAJ4868096.1 Zeta_toxin domain-containing protein [Raphanus sativus]